MPDDDGNGLQRDTIGYYHLLLRLAVEDRRKYGINNKSTGLICRNGTEYSVRDVCKYYHGASIIGPMCQSKIHITLDVASGGVT